MKIRIVTAMAALLLGAAACTPEETAAWARYFAEQEADAPIPVDPPATATRIPFPDACEVLLTSDVEIDVGDESESLVVWVHLGTSDVFGYSRSVKDNIYPEPSCLERSP